MYSLNGIFGLVCENISFLCTGLFYDLFKDLLKVIAGFVFGRIYISIMRWRKPQLRIIDASYSDSCTLYFGNVIRIKDDNRVTAFQELADQKQIYGDIESTLMVSELFCSAFKSPPTYSRFFNGADKLVNIVISVGGPKWNKITETLIGALGSPVSYKEGSMATFITRNKVQKEFGYLAKKINSKTHITDVGIILIGKSDALQKDKRIKAKSVCVVTGYSVYGVRLAVDYLKKIIEDKAQLKLMAKHSKICIAIHGQIQIGDNGEVVNTQDDKVEWFYENEFLAPWLYSY